MLPLNYTIKRLLWRSIIPKAINLSTPSVIPDKRKKWLIIIIILASINIDKG